MTSQRLERALDAPLSEEWEEFRLLARDTRHWDAVWSALVALDRDHHDVVRAILAHCCALSPSTPRSEEGSTRCSRRRRCSRATSRASARTAARPRASCHPPTRAASSRWRGATMRSTRATRSRAPTSARSRARRRRSPPSPKRAICSTCSRTRPWIEPAREAPVALLGAGPDAPDAKPVLLLQSALVELRRHDEVLFGERIAELGYLANVLVAGSRENRPRPVEALEQAMSVCNTGLERGLGADRSLARAVALLRELPADVLFRRGLLPTMAADAAAPSETRSTSREQQNTVRDRARGWAACRPSRHADARAIPAGCPRADSVALPTSVSPPAETPQTSKITATGQRDALCQEGVACVAHSCDRIQRKSSPDQQRDHPAESIEHAPSHRDRDHSSAALHRKKLQRSRLLVPKTTLASALEDLRRTRNRA